MTVDTTVSNTLPTGSSALPAQRNTLRQLLQGYTYTQLLYVAAYLDLAEQLKRGPRSVEELAIQTGTDAKALARVLRGLVGLGVLSQDEPGRFDLTPLGSGLRSDAHGSLRTLALIIGEEWYPAWEELLYSVRTGRPAFDHVFGASLFEYYARHVAAGERFSQRMATGTSETAAAIVGAYDFSSVQRIVDVGGGHGALITEILRCNPGLNGVLFDLPHVAELGRERLEAAGMAERCEVIGGDFFDGLPNGADAYLFSQILHDWDDERCVTILRNCRRAITAGGRILVIEAVMPARIEGPSFAVDQDLLMLVIAGGRERTETEYREIFAEAGFELASVLAVASTRAASVLEGRPV